MWCGSETQSQKKQQLAGRLKEWWKLPGFNSDEDGDEVDWKLEFQSIKEVRAYICNECLH